MKPGKWNSAGGNLRDSGVAGSGEGSNGWQDSDIEASARLLAQVAMVGARMQLDRCALATDAPEPGIVEAADLLDAACAALQAQHDQPA